MRPVRGQRTAVPDTLYRSDLDGSASRPPPRVAPVAAACADECVDWRLSSCGSRMLGSAVGHAKVQNAQKGCPRHSDLSAWWQPWRGASKRLAAQDWMQ